MPITTIGTGIFIVRRDLSPNANHEVLIGRRSNQNKRAPGVWALPGGMREDDEDLTTCSVREVREETGLHVVIYSQGEFQSAVLGISDHFPRESHITVWLEGRYLGGEPKVVEPTKHDCWEWHTPKWLFDAIPQVGEQMYWTPYEIWRTILIDRLGFRMF